MIKRIISGAMSLIVSCSLLTSVDIFNQKDVVIKNQVDNQISGNEDYNLNSTNSLGNYICEVATEQQRLANTASAAESEIFAVSQLEFDIISGEFSVKSSQTKACTAKVSIVEETSGETVLEKTADVKIGEDVITKGTINVSELPEFYYVTAELFDAEGKSLCSKVTCETYTKTMQEILAADIHDFDENLVVNLDESEDTNFLVLDEETIIAESSEDTNNLESADYENNVFVFNNADETIQDLKEGDNFYIQASEQDIIAVSVDSVEVNENNQVIVSGNDENVEEMFSFIKFEGTADTSDAEFDMSTADEGVELDGMVEASNFMENVDAFKININGTSNKRGLFDVDKNFEAQANVTFPIEDKDAGFKASIEVGFKVSFSIYKKRSYVNLELKSEFPFKVSATLGETPSDDPLFEKSFGTAVIPLPVAGIKLEIEPKLVVEAKVTVEASYSATPGFSLTYDSDVGVEFNKLSDSFNSNEKFSLNVSGEAFIGIDFSPRLVAVSKKIAKIEVGLKAGLKITAEMENSISEGNEFTVLGVGYCGDSVHACGLCIKGTADFVLEGSAKLKVLFAEVEASINIGRFSLPDWYFSISNKGKFGLGTCPNLAYNTTFTILDKDGAPLSGAKVVVDSNEYYTDGNGFVNLYAKCQGHSYNVYVDGVRKKSGSFTIYNNTKDLTIKLDGSSVVTNDTPISTATTPVITTVKKVTTTVTKSEKQQMMTAIDSGRLGDNINYIHYADGFMWIHGYGDMYDYSSCPFKYPEKITDIDIESEDPASGLNITSIGNNVFKNCVNVPEFNIPSTVKRIGNNAFYNCSEAKFTDFAFTSNLTSIGNYAFYNCNKLKFGDLKFSSKLTSIGSNAFYNCDGITNATIPGSVNTIGDYAFADCSALKTLVVKDGVGTIGSYILNKCIAVESVTFPYVGNTLENTNKSDSNYQLAARLFNSSVEGKTYYTGNYYVPYTLKKITITGGTRIPANAFEDLSEVTEIIIPNNVTSIGNYAFYRCTSMTTRNLTNKLTSIGNYAFYNCNAAKFNDIVFPSTLTYIGVSAFYNCDKITNVTIPGSVNTIGDYAFDDCSAVKTLVVKDGVGTIGSYILNKCIAVESVTFPYVGNTLENTNKSDSSYQLAARLFNSSVEGKTYYTGNYYVPYTLKKITITGGTRIPTNAFKDLSEVTEIIIPDNVTSIGKSAFYGCSSLITIQDDEVSVFPDTIKSIEDSAFNGCTSLKTTKIPSKIVSIGNYAFANCSVSAFKNVVLPSTLTFIGSNAFLNCDGLTSVTVPGSVNTIGDYAFADCSALKTLVVKDGVGTIGSYILNKCIAVESVTFPYVGNTLENTNKSDSNYQLAARLFNSSVEDKTYYTGNYYVPYSLKKITITGGTRIPANAFEDLSEVTEIIIPNNITSIGNSAFYRCTSLTSRCLTDNLVSIGSSAFYNCNAAKFNDIVFPETLTSIGSNAFYNCDEITNVTIPGSVNTIGDYAFEDCSAIKTLVVKDGVGTIGSYILNKCIAVESVTLPFVGDTLENTNMSTSSYHVASRLFNSNVEDKTYYAHYYYVPYSLKKITITGGTRIPKNAFYKLKFVEEINIPKSITSIGNNAFYNCSNIDKLLFLGDAPEIASNAFTDVVINAYYPTENKTWTDDVKKNYEGSIKWVGINPLKITAQPKNAFGTIGSIVKTSVSATGDDLTYEWYVKDPGKTSFTLSSTKTATYKYEMEATKNERQVYCVIKDKHGNSVTSDTVICAIPASIIKQPTNVSVAMGSNAAAKITATGNDLTYKWYYKDVTMSDFKYTSTFKGDTYKTEMTEARDGRQIYCEIIDKYGNKVKSKTITLRSKVTIIDQPSDVSVKAGSSAIATVKATGNDLTYKWYFKDSTMSTFAYTSTFKGDTYKVEMNASRNGRQIYCEISDKYGNKVQSETVTLTIFAITKQPADVSVKYGNQAVATVEATGNDLTYKWYYKDVTMSDFKYTSTFKGDTYKTEMTEARDGRQIYCIVSDKYGNEVQSKTITLRSKVTITDQPSDVSVKYGNQAAATIEATGNTLTYKWYFKDTTMSSFAYTSTFKGNSYKIKMDETRDGRQIYCIVSDKYGNKVQSETVTLMSVVSIKEQPVDVSAEYGSDAIVTINAAGKDLTYEWYYKNEGMKSFAYTSSFDGDTYEVEMSEARDGRQVYCVISDKYGNKVQSETVTLTSVVSITEQPTDVSVESGSNAAVTINAAGKDLTYEWYYKNVGMKSFAYTSSFDGDTYEVEMNSSRNGRQIYCVITDKYGNKVETDVVTLSIR